MDEEEKSGGHDVADPEIAWLEPAHLGMGAWPKLEVIKW